MRVIYILFAAFLFAGCAEENAVRTHSGMLSGTRVSDVRVFKGIPYAAPPIDELRWRPPQPAEP